MKVIKSRLEDIEVGDVVNRAPDAEMGWFVVDAISILFNGHIQLADVTEQLTVSGNHQDMVGLQLVEEIHLDQHGQVAAPAPAMVAAPMPAPVAATVTETAPAPEPDSGPAQGTASAPQAPPAAEEPTASPQQAPSDLEAEAAAAAEIATKMDAPSGGSRVPPGVNLALVAELLEDLDVGDAPEITEATAPLDTPEPTPPPAPVVPEGAIAVYGDELPETPSYKNPVVVPEGTLLPRRSRAA